MKRIVVLALGVLVTACTEAPVEPPPMDLPPLAGQEVDGDYSGHTLVLGIAEIITDPTSGEAGRTEFFRQDLGNGQLAHGFVYDDPRRFWNSGPELSYALNAGFPSSDVNLEDQDFWQEASITLWTTESCSEIPLVRNDEAPGQAGLVENFFAGGGLNLGLVDADITQLGFRGAGPLFPPGSSVLGVTYTLFWTNSSGQLTDIDGDGRIDAALREIYYNDQFEWSDNGVGGERGSGIFDFPSVAIHEAGHGVSSAHFGSIGVQNGELVAKPRAVMNAIYGGTLRDLTGRDRGAHCGIWDEWAPTD